MKKFLIFLALTTALIFPIIGFAQMDFTEGDCIIKQDLSDYPVCCAEVAVVTGGGVLVQCLGPDDDTGNVSSFPPQIWGPYLTDCCLIDKILTIGDYIFILLLVVAVIMFLLAAWGFLTAQGEPEKVRSAKNYVIYSIIGVAVAFLAKVLVRVVASIMT